MVTSTGQCFKPSSSEMNLKRDLLVSALLLSAGIYLLYHTLPCIMQMYEVKRQIVLYDQTWNITFIGGMPRSGTTLMRALLDAHPEVRCGEETRVIPEILGERAEWELDIQDNAFLSLPKLSWDVIDSAVRSFILEIITKHGKAAPHLCNKDPFSLASMTYLNKLFPNARYLLMIRDGRAVAHSIISRKIIINAFDRSSYKTCLRGWNWFVEFMYAQCVLVGPHHCMPVYYEQLVLHQELWMRRILGFLNIAWNDSVLHHQDYVGKPEGISLSKSERSTDQVINPVNSDALSKWVGNIPEDVMQDMDTIAPMLKTLGYDPMANPPNYADPHPQITDNTLHWKRDHSHLDTN